MINGANAQYGTDKNYAIITNQILQVVSLASVSVAPSSVVGGTTQWSGAERGSRRCPGKLKFGCKGSCIRALQPGVSSATFTITTSKVAATVGVSIKVTDNSVSKSAILTLQPIVPVSLSLSPSTVVGGKSATGKVTINTAAPSGGVNVVE